MRASYRVPDSTTAAEGTTWSVYPTYTHGLGTGSIKFEVSLRETPILTPSLLPQLPQAYFTHLEFAPAELPCLHESELIAEKLRAAYQRRKARDIYDLAVFATRPRQEALIRKVLVLKLIPKRDRETPETFLGRVRRGFSFLGALNELEAELATDGAQRRRITAEVLREECRVLADAGRAP